MGVDDIAEIVHQSKRVTMSLKVAELDIEYPLRVPIILSVKVPTLEESAV